jgi:hypothetical protein
MRTPVEVKLDWNSLYCILAGLNRHVNSRRDIAVIYLLTETRIFQHIDVLFYCLKLLQNLPAASGGEINGKGM